MSVTPPGSNGLRIEIGRVRTCNSDAQIEDFALRDAARGSLISAGNTSLGLAATPLAVRISGIALGANPPLATVGSVELRATMGDKEIAIDQSSATGIRAADDVLVIPNVSIAHLSLPRTPDPDIGVSLVTVGGTAARLERRPDGTWRLPDAAAARVLASGLQEAYALLLTNYARIRTRGSRVCVLAGDRCDGCGDCGQAGIDGGQPVAARDIRCHPSRRRLPAVLAGRTRPGGLLRRRRRHRGRIGDSHLSPIARMAPAFGAGPGGPGFADVDRLVSHGPRFRSCAAPRPASACDHRARADRPHQRCDSGCPSGKCRRKCCRHRRRTHSPGPRASGHTDRPRTSQHQHRGNQSGPVAQQRSADHCGRDPHRPRFGPARNRLFARRWHSLPCCPTSSKNSASCPIPFAGPRPQLSVWPGTWASNCLRDVRRRRTRWPCGAPPTSPTSLESALPWTLRFVHPA